MIRDFSSLGEELNLNNFKIIKIYKGSLWKILFTKNIQTGDEYVMKLLRNDFVIDDHTIEYINRFYIANSLKIPGIVQCFRYRLPISRKQKKYSKIIKKLQYINESGQSKYINVDEPLFCTELIPKGNILSYTNEYLKTKGKNSEMMNPTIRSKSIVGLAAIMKNVHKRNVIHRFLNISNIFLNENLEPKIDGFYFPIEHIFELESEIMLGIFDLLFRAPELMSENYSFPCDVYSYGFILYCLFVGNSFLKNHKKYISRSLIYKRKNDQLIEKTEMIPDNYWDLIQQCLQIDANKRPSFEQITNILMDDKFALNEFDMKTNLDQLHEYQKRINFM